MEVVGAVDVVVSSALVVDKCCPSCGGSFVSFVATGVVVSHFQMTFSM
jgi:hypothetical protein